MTETLDDISILNRALARIGAGEVSGRDEESDLAAQCFAVLDDTIAEAFGAYHWQWCLRTVRLDRLSPDPTNGWRYAFAAPAGIIGVCQGLWANPRQVSNPLRDFQIEGSTVYCDVDAVWGRWMRQVPPDEWPDLFRQATTTLIASALAVPVSHDKGLADQLRTDAIGTPAENYRGGMMGRAIALDQGGSGGPQPVLAADPLTSARHDGPLSGDWWG